MPPPLSRRDFRRQQEFENDLAQQQGDQRAQAGLMQMLESLYGISQQERFAPEKLRGMQAETAGRMASTERQQITNAQLPAQLRQQLDIGQSNLDTSALARELSRAQEGRAGAMHPLELTAAGQRNQINELNIPFIAPTAQSNLDSAALQRKLAEAREGREAGLYPAQQRQADLSNVGLDLANQGATLQNQAKSAQLPFVVPSAQSDLLDADTRRRLIAEQIKSFPSENLYRDTQTAINSMSLPENERYFVQKQHPQLGPYVTGREEGAAQRRAAGRMEEEGLSAPLDPKEFGFDIPEMYRNDPQIQLMLRRARGGRGPVEKKPSTLEQLIQRKKVELGLLLDQAFRQPFE